MAAIEELGYHINLAAGELVHATPAPTMQDVARRAGVSGQTVSRLVNDTSHVTRATPCRVLDAIRQIGYQPNAFGKALATCLDPANNGSGTSDRT